VTLAEEMEVAEAYVFLLKTRFGDNLQVNITINQQMMKLYLAPLTIQMLLENAVKHNIVSSEKPLFIDILTEEQERIVVKNAIQRKYFTEHTDSTHTGLANIVQRYRLLSDKKVEILATDAEFAVVLPLLTVKNNGLVREFRDVVFSAH
jgi:LytS/YehU family sensor histidine kinase